LPFAPFNPDPLDPVPFAPEPFDGADFFADFCAVAIRLGAPQTHPRCP